jgi:hypothetical protein
MIVRREQIEVLAAHCRDNFEKTAIQRVTSTWVEIAGRLGPQQVADIVHYGIARARGYGITGERSTTQFIDVLFQLSPAFDTTLNWASKILNDETLQAKEKMTRISRAVGYELAARRLA